jgi:hypothetical protein
VGDGGGASAVHAAPTMTNKHATERRWGPIGSFYSPQRRSVPS